METIKKQRKVHVYIKAFSAEEVLFLTRYYNTLTHAELYGHINGNRADIDKVSYTTFRYRIADLGLKRFEVVRWPQEWSDFVIDNYTTMGDVDLAEAMNKLFKPARKFTKKHIDKRRRTFLKLFRTPEQVAAIRAKHVENGRYNTVAKAWETMGVAVDGDLRVWMHGGKPTEFVKQGGKFVLSTRFVYESNFGKIPAGNKVYHKDCNRLNNAICNLYIAPAKGLTVDIRMKYQYHDLNNINMLKEQHVCLEAEVIEIESNNKISVKINDKLTLFVKPGTNVELLREKYNNHLRVA